MLFWIIVSIIWLVFGWFTVRLAYYDGDTDIETFKLSEIWPALFGPLIWLIGMFASTTPRCRRKAHFMNWLDMPKFPKANSAIVARIFAIDVNKEK